MISDSGTAIQLCCYSVKTKRQSVSRWAWQIPIKLSQNRCWARFDLYVVLCRAYICKTTSLKKKAKQKKPKKKPSEDLAMLHFKRQQSAGAEGAALFPDDSDHRFSSKYQGRVIHTYYPALFLPIHLY